MGSQSAITKTPSVSPIVAERIFVETKEKSNLTGLYVIIVILILLLIGFGMWYYGKHGYAKNGEKQNAAVPVAPYSPSSIIHIQHDLKFQMQEGNFEGGSSANTGDFEGTDHMGPGATIEENIDIAEAGDEKQGDTELDNIENANVVKGDDAYSDTDDDGMIIQEIETLQGPPPSKPSFDDMDIETIG